MVDAVELWNLKIMLLNCYYNRMPKYIELLKKDERASPPQYQCKNKLSLFCKSFFMMISVRPQKYSSMELFWKLL